MALLDADVPVSVTYTKMRTSTVGNLIASDGFKWSASQRLWSPAGEPWLRRELLIIWTFVIVLSVFTYFVIRVVLQMQVNANTQTRSTLKLTEQVASFSATQGDQGAKIGQVQASYKQMVGVVGDLGHRTADMDTTDHELKAMLKSLSARVRTLEHQQQAKPPAPGPVVPVAASSAVLPPPLPAVPASAPQPKASTPWTQMPGTGHVHQFLSDLVPPKNVDLKQMSEDGTVWVIAKNGVSMAVRPFEISTLGTWVHCLTDNRDYILTPSGGWMGASPRP